MTKAAQSILACAFALLFLSFLVHVGVGSSAWYSPWEVLQEILKGDQGQSGVNSVVWSLRLPRAVQCVLTGAILGTSGIAFQALFRNPLAEPYIVGSSSGAAVGGALVYVLGWSGALFGLAMPLAGFVTGLLALMLVLGLATRRGVVETPTLLLAGVVISTMLASVLSLVILAGGEIQVMVLRWMMGSEAEAFWPAIGLMAVTFAVGFPWLWRLSRRLNALSVGEETAASVGVDPLRTRNLVLVLVTAMVSVTVGAVGIIGFVGLVAPHIARRLVGVDLRRALPLSALVGAMLLLLSDAIAQRGVHGTEIPVGIVTAVLGAPTLLVLIRKRAF